ncbi:GNAT family N-acetyltransferase [Variovorax sp. LT2P21]|uniref:GNAT family N-acetyltransferase n=1 Tax=Variovorax sp. LT2P21 TaxID=3443731 RepID=UPI003F468DC9
MIQQLTLADAVLVASGMRLEDRGCIEAIVGACDAEVFAVNRWQTDGAAWALYQDGRPVAMFGLLKLNPWTLNAWLVATPAMAPQSWKKLLRFSRTVRGNALKATRRIECTVLSTWVRAAGFAEALGFELEGIKRGGAKGGEDILLYAIVKKEKA